MTPFLNWTRIANGTVQFRWFGLAIATLLAMAALYSVGQLKTQRRLETMFAQSDPHRRDFEFLKERFGGNEVVLCVVEIPDLWNEDGSGMSKLRGLSDRLAASHGVQSVMDLSKLNVMLGPFSGGSALAKNSASIPLFEKNNPLAVAFLKLFEGYTHMPEKPTTAIACLLRPPQGDGEEYLRDLESILAIAKDGNAQVIGEPIMVHEGFRLVEADGRRLGIVSSIVLALLILVGFRSLRWTLICILVVQWSILVTQGTIVWLGLEVTMVSSMLSSIVTVIGVAASMHWMLGYQRAYARSVGTSQGGSNQRAVEAIRSSLQSLIRPMFWAGLTDAIGFGSLMIANVGPVRDYGLMMAIASGVVLVGILLMIPGLATLGSQGLAIRMLPGDMLVRWWLAKSLKWVVQRKTGVSLVALILTILSIIGSFRIRVETDFIKNFSSHWPMVQAYQTVETKLGGAGVWDILLPVPAQLSDRYLDQVARLEEELRTLKTGVNEEYKLTKVLSVADASRAAGSTPLTQMMPNSLRLSLMEKGMPDFFHTLLSTEDASGERWLRIMLRSPEQSQSDAKMRLIQQVQGTLDRWSANPEWQQCFSASPPAKPKLTGHFVLLATMVDSLIADQWNCFGLATLGVGLAMMIAIGNLRWVMAAMIPNIVPSMTVLGMFGWLQWPVNLGVALIAAVSMGLSVDSSLHYLIRLKTEMDSGKKLADGLKACQSEVGMSMLVSSAALMLGFGWLAISDFYPTVFFGATAALTMLGGLIGNLWLLPVLITAWDGKANRSASKKQSSQGS